MSIRSRSHPLMIQGLRTNPKDQDSHVLFFDVESLIGLCFNKIRFNFDLNLICNLVQLLSDEYASLSPNTLENKGLTNNAEYLKYTNLSFSPEAQHKFSGNLMIYVTINISI